MKDASRQTRDEAQLLNWSQSLRNQEAIKKQHERESKLRELVDKKRKDRYDAIKIRHERDSKLVNKTVMKAGTAAVGGSVDAVRMSNATLQENKVMSRLVDTVDLQRNTIEAFEDALRSSRIPLADRVEQEMAE